MSDALTWGDVVLVALPNHRPSGREQEGQRPAIIVGLPTGEVRYAVILIAPLTTATGTWATANPALYPEIAVGIGGVTRNSIVLLDQIRAIDARRVIAYLGSLPPEHYQPIHTGLAVLFGFGSSAETATNVLD